MRRTLVPILVVLTSTIAVPRGLPHRQPSQWVPVTVAQDPISKKANTVSYKGVSFTFDLALASDVKSETIPAMVTGKPSDIVPKYHRFRLIGYPDGENLEKVSPEIRVFRVDKFREAVATASKEYAKSVVYPPNPEDWTIYFDKEVQVLKMLLASQPAPANIGRFLAKAKGQRGCSAAMPFLPMWEACQAFVGHVTYASFKNAKGVFFLTQWNRETWPIINNELEYAFQGITNDGKYYVSAEFPVAAPFLPKGDEPEVVAWAEKNYLLSHRSKEYQRYLLPVLTKLEALPADKFQPNLELLEQMIGSLEVRDK